VVLDTKIQHEYLLIRIYEDNIIGRGFLLRIPFVAMEEIESNTWWNIKFSDEEKLRLKSLIQIDILSKIMMYIEDLAILAESFLLKKDFYELIIDKNIDIGKKTGEFIQGIDYLTDENISQIMNFINVQQIISDDRYGELLKQHLNYHVETARSKLKEIRKFSSSANHLLYKRFKHGGMPIIPNVLQQPPRSGALSVFEVLNIVAEGSDPFKDIIIIPYSKDVLRGYEKIIENVQTLLQEIVKNRRICIERNIDGMIPEKYSSDLFSAEEISYMQGKFNDFYNMHPIGEIPHNLDYNINKKNSQSILEKIEWYLESSKKISTNSIN